MKNLILCLFLLCPFLGVGQCYCCDSIPVICVDCDLEVNQRTVHYSLETAKAEPTEVRSLLLSLPDVETFPEIIFRMCNMQELTIRDSEITSLPNRLSTLRKLQEVRIKNGVLSKFPLGLSQRLLVLDLSNNKLEAITNSFPADHPKLKLLLLDQNKISKIPKGLLTMPYLYHLDLSENEIESLPPLTQSQTNLLTLNLSANKLRELPEGLGELTKLEYLRANHNPFEEFPMEILELKNLKELELSNCKFKKIPKEIQQLTKLRLIRIVGTPISRKDLDELRKWLPKTQIQTKR